MHRSATLYMKPLTAIGLSDILEVRQKERTPNKGAEWNDRE